MGGEWKRQAVYFLMVFTDRCANSWLWVFGEVERYPAGHHIPWPSVGTPESQTWGSVQEMQSLLSSWVLTPLQGWCNSRVQDKNWTRTERQVLVQLSLGGDSLNLLWPYGVMPLPCKKITQLFSSLALWFRARSCQSWQGFVIPDEHLCPIFPTCKTAAVQPFMRPNPSIISMTCFELLIHWCAFVTLGVTPLGQRPYGVKWHIPSPAYLKGH